MNIARKFVRALLRAVHLHRLRQAGGGAARKGRLATVAGYARERVEATAGSSTPPKPDSLSLDTPPEFQRRSEIECCRTQ